MNTATNNGNATVVTENFAAPPRGPVDAVRTCLIKFFDFRGRALRSEFWWFFLVFIAINSMSSKYTAKFIIVTHWPISLWAATYLFVHIAIRLPLWSVAVRRLHDTGRTGWWILPDVVNSLAVVAATGYMYYFHEGNFPGSGGGPIDEWMALFEPTRGSDMWWMFGLAVTVHYLFVNGGRILVLCFCLLKGKSQQNRFDRMPSSATAAD